MDTNTRIRDLPSEYLEMTVAELMAAFTPDAPKKVKKTAPTVASDD